MTYADTICAIATPSGEGGIGIVRLSGAQALPIATRIFRPHRAGAVRSHRVRYGHIVDPDSSAVVDEALLTYMRAPRSFTCEDVVELSCHGGAMPVQRTLALALAGGARLAEPGEFTLRAFLNGRIDLSQAEATLDVIRSQTSTSLALAQAQLGGWLAQTIRTIRADLLNSLAYLTATLDFPEDEIEVADITPDLERSLAAVQQLLATADQGRIYRQGARAVIVGRPNAGKSSLLNALLRHERAIVTPIAGTTRDTLEETANIGGIPVVLIDTAGITASDDPVEQIGVARSHAALAAADLVLLVLDSTQPVSPEATAIATLSFAKPTLLVWSKADLRGAAPLPDLPFTHPQLLASVETSVVAATGLDALNAAITQALLGGAPAVAGGNLYLVTNPRHRDALARASARLTAAVQQWATLPPDMIAGDLTAALNALGEITGDVVGDDLLDAIFSRFCIGK